MWSGDRQTRKIAILSLLLVTFTAAPAAIAKHWNVHAEIVSFDVHDPGDGLVEDGEMFWTIYAEANGTFNPITKRKGDKQKFNMSVVPESKYASISPNTHRYIPSPNTAARFSILPNQSYRLFAHLEEQDGTFFRGGNDDLGTRKDTLRPSNKKGNTGSADARSDDQFNREWDSSRRVETIYLSRAFKGVTVNYKITHREFPCNLPSLATTTVRTGHVTSGSQQNFKRGRKGKKGRNKFFGLMVVEPWQANGRIISKGSIFLMPGVTTEPYPAKSAVILGKKHAPLQPEFGNTGHRQLAALLGKEDEPQRFVGFAVQYFEKDEAHKIDQFLSFNSWTFNQRPPNCINELQGRALRGKIRRALREMF